MILFFVSENVPLFEMGLFNKESKYCEVIDNLPSIRGEYGFPQVN